MLSKVDKREIKKETYELVRLKTDAAYCLDGSAGSYYISKKGDPKKILLFFQGGGWFGGLNE